MRPDVYLLAGRYRLHERLGEGGGGTVWRARDETLNRDVAAKQVRIPPNLSPGEHAAVAERAIHEARAAGRLRHPAIVLVHDVVLDHGQPWIIMDLSTGRSLDKVIKQEGPLPPEAVRRIGLQVLGALEVAHAATVLHQDVKPANILIDADGSATLTDFGIAVTRDEQANDQYGSAGSPGYMPPERINGQPSGPASDLWALGASLYTAVEGRAPFQRDLPAAVIAAVLMYEPPFPAKAGRELGGLLMDMLAKDPARRPSAIEIRTRLSRTPRQHRRRRGLVAIALTAVVLFGLGTWYGFSTPGKPDPDTTGRFTSAPDPCGLLDDAQASRLLQGEARHSLLKRDECRWDLQQEPATRRTLTVLVRVTQPRHDRRAPEIAAQLFTIERTNRNASQGEVFTQKTSGISDVPGMGDGAFAQDTYDRAAREATNTIMFRSSNLIGEVIYTERDAKGTTPEQRALALEAAQHVVVALR